MTSSAHPAVEQRRPLVRCAPIRIPLIRRIQTASVLAAGAVFPCILGLLTLMAFYPPIAVGMHGRVLLALYVAWQVLLDRATPRRGGRACVCVRRWRLWRHVADYFPAQLHMPYSPSGFDASRPYIFCLHPHGIISVSAITNLVCDAYERTAQLRVDYRVATVSANFVMPVWRDLLLAMGFVDASRESIGWLLDHGKSAMIVIGGAQETLEAQPGAANLVLAKRTGFVKLALRHGASLVPVYHFGENELFVQAQSPTLRYVQKFIIKWFGFTLPVLRGRGVFQYDWGVLPRRVPLHTVIGRAIDVPRVPNPSKELVQEYHHKYIQALEQLYNENKDKYWKPTDFFGRPLPAQPLRIVA